MIITGSAEGNTSKKMIVENVISMIFNGVLNRGDFLPSIRNLSERYRISRSTIVVAYKELESLGYIEGRERSCYVVVGQQEPKMPRQPLIHLHVNGASPRYEKEVSPTPDIMDIADRLNTQGNATFPQHFLRKWYKNISFITDGDSGRVEAKKTHEALKESLTRYLKITRGIQAASQDILFMQGHQKALVAIAHFGKSLKERPSIILEDPCSPQIYQLFDSLGYEIHSVCVDQHGLDISAFPGCAVDFIYTSPSNNFPSGAKMSQLNRERLLSWSKRNNSLIIEDDACFMLGFEQELIPPLSGEYPADNIIYLYNLDEFIGNCANVTLIMLPPVHFKKFRRLCAIVASDNNLLNDYMVSEYLGSSYLMKYLARTLQARREKFELALDGLSYLEPDLKLWGRMQSSFFSFAMKPERLPAEMINSQFYTLDLFCRAPLSDEDNSRFIYPIGSLSLTEIARINARLYAHHSPHQTTRGVKTRYL